MFEFIVKKCVVQFSFDRLCYSFIKQPKDIIIKNIPFKVLMLRCFIMSYSLNQAPVEMQAFFITTQKTTKHQTLKD